MERRIVKLALLPGCVFSKGTVLEAEREGGGWRRKGREGGTDNGSGLLYLGGHSILFFQEPFAGNSAAT